MKEQYLSPDCLVLKQKAGVSILVGSFNDSGNEHIDYDGEKTL